jgi:hypothetical protein
VAADREAEMREHNLNVDYGFEAVSKEDLDAQPQDKDVKKVKGTQPKKYYKTLSKDVKKKRADYFKNKDTSKNDNAPAPGDKGAKTKPSIHTTKFKKMYGEVYEMGTPEYTKHTIDMTPGQKTPIKKVKGFLDREKEKVSKDDVKEWSENPSTIEKYKEKYKDIWESKLKEVVNKMMDKVMNENTRD